MTTSQKWISPLVAVAALSLFSLSSNAAESNPSPMTRTVKTWDLDFAKSADVQTFNARVRDAAHDVCAAEAYRFWQTTRRAAPSGWRDKCVNDAVDAAVREVGNRGYALNTR